MGIFGGISALLILLWVAGRCAGLTLCFATFIAAILRIVAVTVGFKNFSGGGGFNTSSSLTTAFAILLLQIYIIYEGWNCASTARAENMQKVNA